MSYVQVPQAEVQNYGISTCKYGYLRPTCDYLSCKYAVSTGSYVQVRLPMAQVRVPTLYLKNGYLRSNNAVSMGNHTVGTGL